MAQPGSELRSKVAELVAGQALTRQQFAAQFEAASEKLWCIAAAVLSDRVGAEDVVQEATLVAMDKLHEFEPGTSFTAWMGQIVRYTALNEHRRRRRESTNLRRAKTSGAVSAPEQKGATTGEFDADVAAAIDALDETARACLLMKTTMDLSYEQIADALGIPAGTAMSHVFRARKSVRERVASAKSQRKGNAL